MILFLRTNLFHTHTEAVGDLPEDADNSVPIGQLWCDCRNKERAKIHQFNTPMPGVNHCAVHHISADSSSLECFQLMLTE